MGEPMDDIDGSSLHRNLSVCNENDPKVSPLRRPGSMVMMTITIEDYESLYWPELENAIDQLLTATPGQYLPVSYEQVYSCVYKCVCKQLSERLYTDLMRHITNHLEQLHIHLQSYVGPDTKTYLEKFSFSLNQYLLAVQGIVPVFNYLNRIYVESKLKGDLTVELKKLFVFLVADRHIEMIISLLDNIHLRPLSMSPAIISALITNLHKLRPEYAQLRPHLFARYIPNILPPCSLDEMDKYIQEVQQMQRDLLTHPDFFSGDQGKKRSCEEEQLFKTPSACLPQNGSS